MSINAERWYGAITAWVMMAVDGSGLFLSLGISLKAN